METAPQLATFLIAAVLYGRRRRRVRGRSPGYKPVCFAIGLGLLVAALVSPIDSIGEERLFSVHMVQHLLIGDLAPLFIVLGLDGPMLRPLLALRPVRALRVIVNPLVALPVWAINLCSWHLPVLYDAALDHDLVHVVQHALFFTCGALLWAALLEPLPGPAWFTAGRKLLYVGVMWLVSLALSQVFLWSDRPYYTPYLHVPRLWGLDPLADQRAGGGVMLVEGTFVMLGIVVWLLLRIFAESEARQRLLDAGVQPAVAARAARYGRAYSR